MTTANRISTRHYPCQLCPLRPLGVFREFEPDELAFVSTFKIGELRVDRAETIVIEGSQSPYLYTVLLGWGFRYKVLPDGRRQILNYLIPGDLIGLQGSLTGEMQHSVEALSPMLLCVFQRDQLFTLYRNHPGLAYDLTWLSAREEQMLDETLLSVGRRSALERAAYLIAFISQRARALRLFRERAEIPITQQHVADTLGLSIVHTNKTLRKLAERGLIRWLDRGCEVIDEEGLRRVARWEGLANQLRPLV